MSLKQLEETIKLRPQRDWKAHAEQYYMTMEKWFKEVLDVKFAEFKKLCVCIQRKRLEELVEAMPKALDKKYECRDVNGLKQIRLYDFLPNLRTWKKKLKELLEESK